MICELDMPHSSRVPHLKGKRHTLRLQVLGLNQPVETVVNPPDIPDRVEMVEKWVGGVVAENGEGGRVGEVEGGEGGDSEEVDDSEEDDSEESEDDEDEDEDEYEEAHEGEWNDAEEHLIDLGPPNDIPDWPEISNQTSSSMSWRCTTCDETMSIFFRDQHLSGKSHANALRKGVQTQDSEVTLEPIIPPSMTWHCTICDETMGIFYKGEHLSGKPHVKKLQARGLSQDPADSIGVPETASSTYWVPDGRDTEVNGVNDSLDHVVGGFSPGHQTARRHRTYAEVLRLRATSNNKAHYTSRPASAGDEIPPHIAGASTRGLGPGLHNQDEKDVKKSDDWTINNLVWSQIAKWTCMTCSMTMEMSEKEAHLDSTSHIARCNCPACTRYKSRTSKESHITDTKDTEEVPAETQPLELKTESGGPQHLDEPELYPGEKTKIYPKPKPGMFHCRICDDEFILEYKWMHLSKAWECKTCDKWIHVDWRDRHIERHAIQSEKIKAREAAAEAPAAISAPDEPPAPPAASVSVKEEYYCPVCKKNLTMKQKARHQWGAWQCMDCDLTVHILSGNRDMVCRRGARKSHGQEQKHETQFLRDLGLKEEDTKPSELIDLLGDDIDISIQEFSPMSEVGNQSFDDSLWGLMLGEGGAATYSGDVDLLEVFGLESKTEDQPQSTTANVLVETPLGDEAAHEKKSTLQKTDEIKDIEPSDEKEEVFEASHSDAEPEGQLQNTNVCAPSVVDVSDFELTHGRQNHLPECAEELAEVETEQPLDEQGDVSSETSSSIAESEELEGMGRRPPTFEGSPAYEDSLRSEGGLSQLTEEIGDAQSSHKQAEISPEAPSPALETFHCTVCEVDLSIEKKKYHHGRAWECQVCDKKMHRSSRDSHLAGAKHRKHELLGSKKSLVATQLKAAAAVPVIPEVPVAPGIPVIPVAQARKVSETQSEPPTATDPETFFCETCNKMFKTKIKKIHQTREWECTVCDIKTHIAWKMSHLAGSKHVRREEKALLANAVADSDGSV